MTERFSISLEEDLLARFETYLTEHGYRNRSEAIRDLIRKALIADEWDAGKEVVGVLTLVYDHHQRQLQDRITDIQHDFHELVISTTHIHLDHHNCLEVGILKGAAGNVRNMADQLIALRGVKSGDLTTTGTA